jgi:hypothetical protein
MKKSLLIFMIYLFSYGFSFAQLTGIKTIPGDYATVAAAIADLNSAGVGEGGVVFNITAGHTETLSSPASGLITATGAETDPIVFKKSGTGANPLIIAATPGIGTKDYIICIGGGDYITFDGIDLQENSVNMDAVSWMEYGFAFFKASASNGAQHNIIRNSAISLSINPGCYGICVQNWSYAAPGTALTLTNVSGTNSWNRFYNLTFSMCYNGINLDGFNAAAPYTLYDQGNEVGVDGANNFFGLAAPTATAACYGMYVRYQNDIKLANNLFTGDIPMGNGNVNVMFLQTATNANVDVYGNTISMNYTGTGSFAGLYCNGLGAGGTTNTVNFHHNRVISTTLPNLTSLTSYFMYLITGGVNANFYANEVSNNTVGSATATATAIIYYCSFQSNPTTPGTTSIHDNIVSNNSRIQSSVGSGSTYIFMTNHTGNLVNVYNNKVENIVVGSTNLTYGFFNTGGGLVANYYNNSISNITDVRGLIYGYYSQMGSGNYSHYNNKISNIEIASGSGPLYGICQNNTGNAIFNYYNNYISELRAPSSPATIHGINIAGGSTVSIFNNTIFLDAASTANPFNVTGIYTSTTPVVDMRNNIVVNVSTPTGTGRAVVYERSSTTLSTYANTSNNNNFYPGLPGSGNLIFYDGTNSDLKLPNFKDRVSPRDASTITENPPFVNVAAMPYDLHMLTGVPTQCESAAGIISSPVNLTKDYDDNWRFPNPGFPENMLFPASAPDIGADEFGGLGLDLTSPTIVATPFQNTSFTTARTLVATISDPAGVPVSGSGLPVLYWKINTGTWNSVQSTSLGGGQYTFTFGGGVSLNDVVSYYIVAQDMLSTPNVGSNPGGEAGGFSANPPACATPPAIPLTYTIVGALSGVYPVGTGQVYATITAAISDLGVKEVTGPVTFELWDPLYSVSETFPVVINEYLRSNDLNTVTIRPKAGVNTVITGTSTSGIIRLNGCRNIILEGSDGINPGRSMTIENTSNVNQSFTVGLFRSNNAGASNCTIRNCVIKSFPHLTLDTYGIRFDPQGGGYDNIVIDNNHVCSARIGIMVSGSQNYYATNCRVTNNLVGSTLNEITLTRRGIYLLYASNTLIEGNDVIGPVNGNAVVVQTGMMINQGTPNTRILKNKIHDWYCTGAAAVYGIYYQGADATNSTEISNNLIYNIKSKGGTSANQGIYGIFLVNGGNLKIHHNSIYLAGQITSATSVSQSAPLYITSGVTLLDIINNILVNSLTPVSGTPASKNYAIVNGTGTPAVFSNLDHNDYFVNGYNAFIGYQGSDQTTLADWQTATGKDLASQNVDPLFPAYDNLHTEVPALNNAGVYLPAVTTDFNGVLRTDPPDPGAYEFSLPITSISTLAATSVGQTSATLNGEVNTNGEVVGLSFEYGPTTAYGNTWTAVPSSLRSLATQPFSATLSGLPPNTLIHYRAKGVSTTSNQTVYGQNMTFDLVPQPTIQGADTACQGSTDVIYYTETGKANYQWTVSQGGSITFGGTATSSFVMVTWHGSGAQLVSVNYENTNGVPGPSPAVIQVNITPVAPVSVTILATATNVCQGASVGYTATPVNGGQNPTFQWQINGINVGTNSPNYAYVPVSGDVVTCILTSSEQCSTGSPATSNSITMTVNPILPVSISIAASSTQVCAGTQVVFTATPVNGGQNPTFQWQINGINVGTNSPNYAYVPVSGDVVTCILTSSEQCSTGSPATSNSITMTVNPILPVSISIAASSTQVCAGTQVVFTATLVNGGSNPTFQWKVNGTNVGTNSSDYAYIPANGDVVTCLLTSSEPCTTGNPATSNAVTMTVNPLLPVSISIAASANPVTAGTAVTFTATPVNGGLSPVYQWKVNGVNAGTNNATYTYTPANGDLITCVLTSDEACTTGNPATSNTVSMAVNPAVPVNTSATGTIGSGESNCYNATQTITVAGGGSTFVVQNGGSATMIAGQNIIYLPGTMVEPGGYMHGWITTNNQYCGSLPPAMVAVATETEDQGLSEAIAFRIYPNPTAGAFTLERVSERINEEGQVIIYDLHGKTVLSAILTGKRQTKFDLTGTPAGLYVVRVVTNGQSQLIKLIKTAD